MFEEIKCLSDLNIVIAYVYQTLHGAPTDR